MARSKWKFNFFSKKLLQKNFTVLCLKTSSKLIFQNRKTIISKLFDEKNMYVFKGLSWTKIKISKLHVGHKLGEFGLTKKPFYFPLKEKAATKLHKR